MTQRQTDTERAKYERTWTHANYRNVSPGEMLVQRAVDAWAPGTPASVIDLGCGTGRASLGLQRHGVTPLLVDIAQNARDIEATHLPFLRACLWDLPDISADAVFCCDVLEHIPTERIPAVLAAAARCAPRAFFQIAMFPDEWHGQTLHLTVEEAPWWEGALSAYYRTVAADVDTSRGRRLIAVCER